MYLGEVTIITWVFQAIITWMAASFPSNYRMLQWLHWLCIVLNLEQPPFEVNTLAPPPPPVESIPSSML